VAQATLVAWAKKHRDSVGGAIMYHADYVNPYWVDAYHLTKKVGDHLFYTDAALP
jgi:spore germination cell wall hydrolase CwlJ-like protein